VIDRVLLAVEYTAAGLQAARIAVELAAARRARLHVVHVLADGEIGAALGSAAGDPSLHERRRDAGARVLARVAKLAALAGVQSECHQMEGGVAEQVLAQARLWEADLIVMGRGSLRRPGEPYVSAQTRHVLEFANQPVVVVPAPRRNGPATSE
jgi:nucleotide-binding universal stress UspA family protein